ncbi:RNA dependent RNA polymerase [Cypovirus 14]|uniref:RNA-directed RNA polymerase n=1 Tax=Lymantria dispar cypovirus 14 TaxID=165429 RepID=Q91IF2_9REOV|nr:RNA dependent RNA polymerase [Cypovirus 14]AAK73087.1 RNA dependent RNA polymerase [Lymantria dispar cypovirus 14]
MTTDIKYTPTPEIIQCGYVFDPTKVQSLKDERFRLLSSKSDEGDLNKSIFNYIKNESPASKHWIGKDVNGHVLRVECLIPIDITQPPDFDLSMYPLDDSETMFADDHDIDYLRNCKVSSLMLALGETEREQKLIAELKFLMTAKHCQTRVAKVWKQLLIVVKTLDDAFKTKEYPLRYFIAQLFCRGINFPFYQKRGERQHTFVFESTDVSSVLPLLTYTCMSIGTAIMTGVLSHVESVVAMNNMLEMARTSFVDEKLKYKSIARNWLTEALHNLGDTLIPVWNASGDIRSTVMKNTNESAFVRSQIEADREKRKQLNSVMTAYLGHVLSKCNSYDSIRRYYTAVRVMTNDGAYLSTLTELSLDKAVQPIASMTAVQRPAVLEHDASGRAYRQTYTSGELSAAWNYLRPFASEIATKLTKTNLDELWLGFITTSSPGRKLEETILRNLHVEVQKWSGKSKIVMEAVLAPKYRDMSRYTDALTTISQLVERIQIDRRQRAISGLSNERLFLSFLSYVIGKEIYNLNSNAAQGKQAGNALDIQDMLYLTTLRNTIQSSIDISGMDASIQPEIKELYNTLTLETTGHMNTSKFGPFMTKTMEIKDTKTGSSRRDKVNAAKQAIMYEIANTQTSTTYNSKIFGEIKSGEGTYPSGRADTSTHHTVLLQAILRGNELRRCSEGKASSLIDMRILGDDVRLTYHGSEDLCIKHANEDAEALNKCGFKVTQEYSKNSVTLLQQLVVNGSFWGFPDRISLWTRERQKGMYRYDESAKEATALCDDMMSRIPRPEGLKMLLFNILFLGYGRLNMAVSRPFVNEFVKLIGKHVQYELHSDNLAYKTRLISVYLPFYWSFMAGGGELQPYPFMRSDGSYTPDHSMYSARGPYLRRNLYDISGAETSIINEEMVKLDHELLTKYDVLATQLFMDLNFLNLKVEAKRELLPPNEIERLASDLEALGNADARVRSKIAYGSLKREMADIPKGIVYGYDLYTKIEQTALDQESTEEETKLVSMRMLMNLRKYANNRYIRAHDDDVLHEYCFNRRAERANFLPMMKHLKNFSIAANMEPFSDGWALLGYLGLMDPLGSELRAELASIRGGFHKMSYADPRFKTGFRIYNENARLLETFFVMIGADGNEQEAMRRAFAYFSMYGRIRYEYIQSPRQLFFINNSPIGAARFLVGTEYNQSSSAVQALFLTYTYLHILSNISDYSGELLELRLSDKLRKHLRIQQVHG